MRRGLGEVVSDDALEACGIEFRHENEHRCGDQAIPSARMRRLVKAVSGVGALNAIDHCPSLFGMPTHWCLSCRPLAHSTVVMALSADSGSSSTVFVDLWLYWPRDIS